jgi:hypothetical protein
VLSPQCCHALETYSARAVEGNTSAAFVRLVFQSRTGNGAHCTISSGTTHLRHSPSRLVT